MACDVVVVGGINVDFLAQGEALPSPGTSRAGDIFLECPGGKGANQAVAAARLGVRVALIGAVGRDDRGQRLLTHLRNQHVDVDYVTTSASHSTGVALIHLDRDGNKQILAVLGANGHLDAAHVRSAAERLSHARVVVAQLEVPISAVTEAFVWARRIGARTVLDPAPIVPLPATLLTLVDIIRPNASEATALTGIEVRDRKTAREAATALLRKGPSCAIVQAGDEGNLVVSAQHEQWLPHIDVEHRAAIGAGDAFTGTLAACLAKALSLEEAAGLANAAAALETTALGAQSPPVSEAQLRALAERHARSVVSKRAPA